MRVAHVAAMLLVLGLLVAPSAAAAPPDADDLVDPSCFEETKQLYESPTEAAGALVFVAFCLVK